MFNPWIILLAPVMSVFIYICNLHHTKLYFSIQKSACYHKLNWNGIPHIAWFLCFFFFLSVLLILMLVKDGNSKIKSNTVWSYITLHREISVSITDFRVLLGLLFIQKYIYWFIQIHYQLMHIIKNIHSLHFKNYTLKCLRYILKLRLKTRHVSVIAIRPLSGVHSACTYTTTNVRAISHTRMWLCVTYVSVHAVCLPVWCLLVSRERIKTFTGVCR
jgi:hypothetical protein